jgi:hypothetical protein
MKYAHYLILLLITSMQLISSAKISDISDGAMCSFNHKLPLCNSDASCADKKNNCTCWCSVKCGPRDKKADDTPKTLQVAPDKSICFCAERDIKLAHQCGTKIVEHAHATK